MALDGRKLSHEALEAIRIRAVKAVQSGQSPEVVIAALGMSRGCIYDWLAAYRAGGFDALKAKKLNGRPKKLDGKQLAWIYKAITGGNPMQYAFEFALWTRDLVRALIWKRFKVKLSLPSISRLLHQLGLTPQKPLFKAYQQNKQRVEKWLKYEYPRIKLLAKKVGATIYFTDEAGVRSDFHAGTTWAPKGKTPVIEATWARFKVSMISAVSAQGEMRFMVVDGTVGAEVFIDFLKRFLVGQSKPAFLIVDGARTHRAKIVSEFVASTNGMLRLFFLPGYSPELNPDELVWNDLKNNIVGRQLVSTQRELKSKVVGGLRRIQKDEEKVRSFFAKESTRYAA